MTLLENFFQAGFFELISFFSTFFMMFFVGYKVYQSVYKLFVSIRTEYRLVKSQLDTITKFIENVNNIVPLNTNTTNNINNPKDIIKTVLTNTSQSMLQKALTDLLPNENNMETYSKLYKNFNDSVNNLINKLFYKNPTGMNYDNYSYYDKYINPKYKSNYNYHSSYPSVVPMCSTYNKNDDEILNILKETCPSYNSKNKFAKYSVHVDGNCPCCNKTEFNEGTEGDKDNLTDTESICNGIDFCNGLDLDKYPQFTKCPQFTEKNTEFFPDMITDCDDYEDYEKGNIKSFCIKKTMYPHSVNKLSDADVNVNVCI